MATHAYPCLRNLTDRGARWATAIEQAHVTEVFQIQTKLYFRLNFCHFLKFFCHIILAYNFSSFTVQASQ